jgi:tRNA dimethylallyltransferase
MHLTGRPLWVILGPTAVGKTGLALELAQRVSGEIVSADSRQVYRYMDMGTAKPTPEQQSAVPHHLIDIVDPDENLALAQFQALAYTAIDDIHERGGIPLLVGGTGQYISAVIDGWSIPAVPPNDALRAELESFARDQGPMALHDRLASLDATAAANIPYQNVRRVIRALEVCIETGQQITELQRKSPPPYQVVIHGLTLDRDDLYEQADRRVDLMIEQGFVEEVARLLEMGYPRTLPSMSGLGYREIARYLDGEIPLDTAILLTKNATHDFIRRQYTWFRKMGERVMWHNVRQVDIHNWADALHRSR